MDDDWRFGPPVFSTGTPLLLSLRGSFAVSFSVVGDPSAFAGTGGTGGGADTDFGRGVIAASDGDSAPGGGTTDGNVGLPLRPSIALAADIGGVIGGSG